MNVPANNSASFWPLLLAVALIMAVASCAPASGGAPDTGPGVGAASPPFAMTLVDGSQVTSQELDAADQPVHLFWFATWWPECRAELQTLDPIASEYGEIDFYVVAYNESAAEVEQYITEQGYTDLIAAQPEGAMLEDLEITRQMAMVAVNSEGVIYHRQLMGSADQWAPYFAELTADPDAVPSRERAEEQKDRRLMDMQLPAWWQ